MTFWYARQRALQTVAFGKALETEGALAVGASVASGGPVTLNLGTALETESSFTVSLPAGPVVTAEGALTSVSLVNETAGTSPADQPYTFGAVFEPGRVFSDGHVEVQFAGTPITFQMDREVRRHADGSLNRAVFSVLAPTVNAGGTAQLNLVAKTGSKPSGSVGLSALQSADYSVEVDVGGVTYTASLNDAITAATYDTTRDGPVATRIVARRKLNDGAADHADLWVRFYATAFSDGTTQVLGQVVNGYVANGTNYTVSEARLKAGASAVWTYNNAGAGWQINHHSSFYTADADALPYWSQNKPVLHHKADRGYIAKAKAFAPYRDVSGIAAPAALDYVPGDNANIDYSLNATGSAGHIGFVPNWSSKHFISQADAWRRVDRINALAWTDCPIVYMNESGRIPNLSLGDFTGDGMDASQYAEAWAGDSTLTNPTTPWSTPDGSHNPEPAYMLALVEGDEWWDDVQLLNANNGIGVGNPGRQDPFQWISYVRRVRNNADTAWWNGLVRRNQNRGWGWTMRGIECAHWIVPESAPERGYIGYVREQNYGYIEECIDHDWSLTDRNTLGLIWGRTTTENWEEQAGWQSSMMSLAPLLALWRDGAGNTPAQRFVDYHVKKCFLGAAFDGCPWGFGPYYKTYRTDLNEAKTDWANVETAGGNMVKPAGGCPLTGINHWETGGTQSTESFVIVSKGGAAFASFVGAQIGDNDLERRGKETFMYCHRNDVNTETDYASAPQFGLWPSYKLDFQSDAMQAEVDALAVDTWSAAINTTQYMAQVPDRNSGAYDYDGTHAESSGNNPFAFSSGDYVEGLGYIFTGGGHNDWLGSEAMLLNPKTLAWERGDSTARYSDTQADPSTPWNKDTLPFLWRNEHGRFAPMATHTYGAVVSMPELNAVWVHGGAGYRGDESAGGSGGDTGAAWIDTHDTHWYEEKAFPPDGAVPGSIFAAATDQWCGWIPEVIDTSDGTTRLPGKVVIFNRQNAPAYWTLFDPIAGESQPASSSGSGSVFRTFTPDIMDDPLNAGRKAIIAIDRSDTQKALTIGPIDGWPSPSVTRTLHTMTGTIPSNILKGAMIAMDRWFSGSTKVVVAVPGAGTSVNVHILDTSTWAFSAPVSIAGSLSGTTPDGDVRRRFFYMPEYGAFGLVNNNDGDLYIVRLSEDLS